MKALLSVLEKGRMNKTELVESISVGASSVSSRIDELSEAGLFHVEEEEFPPFRKMVSLTDMGEQVAELISSIHGKLSD